MSAAVLLLRRLAPDWIAAESPLQPGYVIVNLGASFLAAAGGGFVTAWAARGNPLLHVLALAIIVLGLAALSALQARGKLPIWYQLLLVAITPFGVLAGGLAQVRAIGIL
jgi:NADH:ubiquinone oxidoreductase subunit 6 (subunit J)